MWGTRFRANSRNVLRETLHDQLKTACKLKTPLHKQSARRGVQVLKGRFAIFSEMCAIHHEASLSISEERTHWRGVEGEVNTTKHAHLPSNITFHLSPLTLYLTVLTPQTSSQPYTQNYHPCHHLPSPTHRHTSRRPFYSRHPASDTPQP